MTIAMLILFMIIISIIFNIIIWNVTIRPAASFPGNKGYYTHLTGPDPPAHLTATMQLDAVGRLLQASYIQLELL